MRLLYVDDELPALERFKLISARLPDVEAVFAFSSPTAALEFAQDNYFDIAFLDIEMPEMNGIELAKKLKSIDQNIKIVFVTAYTEYALDAFGADAIDYLLKPYNQKMIQKVIDKSKLINAIPKNKVYFKTMPYFEMYVNETVFPINSGKPKELLALLADKNGAAVTAGYAIACLWEDRPYDDKTHSLYRMTCKRLKEILHNGGIDNIIITNGSQRYINTKLIDSDYIRLMNGDQKIAKAYGGEYMSEYSWAEDTNARIMNFLHFEY